MPPAKFVQQPPSPDAQLRLQAAGAIVDARVDDLAVARARLRPDCCVALNEDRGGIGAEGELAGYGEADDATTYDLEAGRRVSCN